MVPAPHDSLTHPDDLLNGTHMPCVTLTMGASPGIPSTRPHSGGEWRITPLFSSHQVEYALLPRGGIHRALHPHPLLQLPQLPLHRIIIQIHVPCHVQSRAELKAVVKLRTPPCKPEPRAYIFPSRNTSV
jgi:hypothetical protein